MVSFSIEISGIGDAVDTDEASYRLADELRGIDGCTIDRQMLAATEQGAKGDAVTAGVIALNVVGWVAGGAMPMIFESMRDWVGRQRRGCTLRIKNDDIDARISGDTPHEAIAKMIEHLQNPRPAA